MTKSLESSETIAKEIYDRTSLLQICHEDSKLSILLKVILKFQEHQSKEQESY